MIHPYTNFVLESVLNKRIRSTQKQDVVNAINYGPVVDTTPVEQWERNIRILTAITNEFGILFYAFLQPTMGIGKYSASSYENEILKSYNYERGERYIDEVHSFYKDAIKVCNKYNNVFNLVDVLKDS